jgi:acyl-coenzyme A synthetase/AMP-(fatty) acid ligase
MASQIGSTLRSVGVRPGNVLLISTGKYIWDYVFALAAMHEAAVVAFSVTAKYNPAFEADFVFSNKPIAGAPDEKWIRITREWLASATSGIVLPPRSFAEENPIVRLVETSGTTGQPKVLEFDFESFSTMYEANTSGSLGAVEIEENLDRAFNQLSFSGYGGTVRAYAAIRSGHPYFMPINTQDDDVRMIGAYKLEHLVTSPSRLAALFAAEVPDDVFASLRTVVTSGAAMPKQLLRLVQTRSKARVFNRLGSTEAGGVAWREILETDEPSLVGKPYPWADIKVVDDQDTPVEPGQTGRIGVKTPYMRTGYRNNPEATAKHFVDGYFYAGDEGYLDETGRLFLVGRSDERINSGGVKLDPNLIDETLLSVEGVRDAAVFGFDDQNGLRAIGVALVLKSGFSMADVANRANRALGTKRASAYLEVLGIPRNQMGKVQRIELEKTYGNQARKLRAK